MLTLLSFVSPLLIMTVISLNDWLKGKLKQMFFKSWLQLQLSNEF